MDALVEDCLSVASLRAALDERPDLAARFGPRELETWFHRCVGRLIARHQDQRDILEQEYERETQQLLRECERWQPDAARGLRALLARDEEAAFGSAADKLARLLNQLQQIISLTPPLSNEQLVLLVRVVKRISDECFSPWHCVASSRCKRAFARAGGLELLRQLMDEATLNALAIHDTAENEWRMGVRGTAASAAWNFLGTYEFAAMLAEADVVVPAAQLLCSGNPWLVERAVGILTFLLRFPAVQDVVIQPHVLVHLRQALEREISETNICGVNAFSCVLGLAQNPLHRAALCDAGFPTVLQQAVRSICEAEQALDVALGAALDDDGDRSELRDYVIGSCVCCLALANMLPAMEPDTAQVVGALLDAWMGERHHQPAVLRACERGVMGWMVVQPFADLLWSPHAAARRLAAHFLANVCSGEENRVMFIAEAARGARSLEAMQVFASDTDTRVAQHMREVLGHFAGLDLPVPSLQMLCRYALCAQAGTGDAAALQALEQAREHLVDNAHVVPLMR